jgi:hypothetical protein
MTASKRDEVRAFIRRAAEEALLLKSTRMSDRTQAEVVRQISGALAESVCWHVCEEYRYLELLDIFEWKRERVRR